MSKSETRLTLHEQILWLLYPEKGDVAFRIMHKPLAEEIIKTVKENTADKTTYDSVSLGWEDEHHYRIIVSIKDGQIIKSAKVSDDSLRNSKHGQVITENHIQEYGENYL